MKSFQPFFSSPQFPKLLLLLAVPLAFGCTTGTDAQSSLADGDKGLEFAGDLTDPQLVRVDCQVHLCEVRFEVWSDEGLDQEVYYVVGPEDEVGAFHRDLSAAANGTIEERSQLLQAFLENRTQHTVIDTLQRQSESLVGTPTAEQGTYSAFTFAVKPQSAAVAANVMPYLASANELPLAELDETAHRLVEKIVSDRGVDQWRFRVEDRRDLGDPSYQVDFSSESGAELDVHFVCDTDFSSEQIRLAPHANGNGTREIYPSCTTLNDSGTVYIEVRGMGSYRLEATTDGI